MKYLLPLVLVVHILQLNAQNATLFNRSIAFSYVTGVADIVASENHSWIFCGNDQPCSTAFVSRIDSSGNVVYTSYLAVPDNYYHTAFSVSAIDSNYCVVAGLCMPADDVGPVQGFVTKINANGNQIWTKVFDPVFYDVKILSNSTIALFGSENILVLDQEGNLLSENITDPFNYDDILDDNFILANESEIKMVDSTGNEISNSSLFNVLAIAGVDSNHLAVVADNKLQLFDYNLNLISSSVTLGNFVQATLITKGGNFWIEASTANGDCSLLYLDDSLSLSYSKTLPAFSDPYYYNRNFLGLAIDDSLLAVIGNEYFILSGSAAIKTFESFSGETADLSIDVNLVSDERNYLGYTVDSLGNNYWLTEYHYDYLLEIQNTGTDTIREITINGNLPGQLNCSPGYIYLPLENLDVAPGETFQYTLPVIISLTGFIAPLPIINFSSCVWLSSPNGHLDVDLSNNYSCKLITGIEAFNDKSPIKIFPNPAIDYVQLTLLSNHEFRMEIYDASGRIAADRLVVGNITLDVRNYSPGYYLISFSNYNSKWYQQLIIQE